MTNAFQQKRPRIGNYYKRAIVRSEHSCDTKAYKIIITIIINIQIPAFLV